MKSSDMHSWRWDKCGEPTKEVRRGKRENGGLARCASPEAISDPAAAIEAKAREGKGWPTAVAAEAFECLAVTSANGDAGIKRKTVGEG